MHFSLLTSDKLVLIIVVRNQPETDLFCRYTLEDYFPITSLLVVNQRHKHKLVFQVHGGVSDLDSQVDYNVLDHFVDVKKFAH